MTENEEVAVSMSERISLLKTEVENRGEPWIELEELKKVDEDTPNGDASNADDAAAAPTGSIVATGATDGGQNGESEEGVYL